ncbi:hypothetical protein [Lutibacter sp.]|uniref:hypothetical protein n=1 Tax=Lutibacter sp. TaxID=1925666 RepID=UPI003563A4E0
MAKNKAIDLNDILFQTIQNIIDPEVDNDGKIINEITVEKAEAVAKVGQVMVNNMKMQVDAMKLVASGNIKPSQLPDNLQGNFKEIDNK